MDGQWLVDPNSKQLTGTDGITNNYIEESDLFLLNKSPKVVEKPKQELSATVIDPVTYPDPVTKSDPPSAPVATLGNAISALPGIAIPANASEIKEFQIKEKALTPEQPKESKKEELSATVIDPVTYPDPVTKSNPPSAPVATLGNAISALPGIAIPTNASDIKELQVKESKPEFSATVIDPVTYPDPVTKSDPPSAPVATFGSAVSALPGIVIPENAAQIKEFEVKEKAPEPSTKETKKEFSATVIDPETYPDPVTTTKPPSESAAILGGAVSALPGLAIPQNAANIKEFKVEEEKQAPKPSLSTKPETTPVAPVKSQAPKEEFSITAEPPKPSSESSPFIKAQSLSASYAFISTPPISNRIIDNSNVTMADMDDDDIVVVDTNTKSKDSVSVPSTLSSTTTEVTPISVTKKEPEATKPTVSIVNFSFT